MSGTPLENEIQRAQSWAEKTFTADSFPVSFKYGEKESAEIIKSWKRSAGPKEETAESTKQTITLTDPATGLECRVELSIFKDYPAVEWVAHLKNTGKSDTPIIENIQAMDAFVDQVPKDLDCCVHYSLGSNVRADDFMPMKWMLYPGGTVKINQASGRSSSEVALPFFNLDMADKGVIGAIGWTGGWKLDIGRRSATGKIGIRAGMAKTYLKLHPGEEIRTPRMMLLFWEGEKMHGHNMLRRFILAHHTPRPNGEMIKAPVCLATWGENTTEYHLNMAQWWKDSGIPLDVYWIDAGWYGDAPFIEGSDVFVSQWANQAGNWWPNKTTYPDGMKPIGDKCKELGFDLLLWVEPERCLKGSWIHREHPDWLTTDEDRPTQLVNLGNPEARKWITDLVSGLIEEGGVTFYRQDFNMSPAEWWDKADEPDRIGICEIRHIEGLYAFWDELLTRHPFLRIDNCSSGGRRIDLEMISRSIALWRSDYQCFTYFDPIGMQGQTHGLGLWVPLSTGDVFKQDKYHFRSAMGPGMVINSLDVSMETLDIDTVFFKKMVEEQQEIGKYFYGDFYPLLSYNQSDDTWAAWQFDRPDLNEGIIMAFRRPRCRVSSIDVSLNGLDPDAAYEVTSFDDGSVLRFLGSELMCQGITVEIAEKPGSALLKYKKLD